MTYWAIAIIITGTTSTIHRPYEGELFASRKLCMERKDALIPNFPTTCVRVQLKNDEGTLRIVLDKGLPI